MKRSKVLLVQRPDLRRKQDPDQQGHNQPAGERQPRPFRPTQSHFASPSSRVRREPHLQGGTLKGRSGTKNGSFPRSGKMPILTILQLPKSPQIPPGSSLSRVEAALTREALPLHQRENPLTRKNAVLYCFGPNEGEQWQSQQWPAIRRSKISPPT